MYNKPIYFKQLELGPMQNFVYIIGDPNNREAAVVDPGWEAKTILDTIERDGYHLTTVIVTHHHFDHVMGLPELLKVKDLPVYVHRDDASLLNVERSAIYMISGGDVIGVGGIRFNVLHTPGHTPGSVCILMED